MGDVVIRRQSDAWRRLIASVALLAVAAGAGCTSSKPARVVEATPAAASAAPAEAKTSAPAPAEIRSLDLREGAPEVYIDLEASAPLVWTSFRNADGKVVVELPNAVPKAGSAGLSPGGWPGRLPQGRERHEGSRPMTRLVIATRHEAEHSVTAEGNNLRVQLMPVEEQAARGGKLAFEPIAAAPAASATPAAAYTAPDTAPDAGSAPAPSRAAGGSLGTPDRPAVAPAPDGAMATRLEGIEVLASEGGAVVRIAGDGEFPYSTFALDEPERFIIDLDGVINRSPRPTLAVDGGILERVRVAQFKPYPKPVSRVVFDLRGNGAGDRAHRRRPGGHLPRGGRRRVVLLSRGLRGRRKERRSRRPRRRLPRPPLRHRAGPPPIWRSPPRPPRVRGRLQRWRSAARSPLGHRGRGSGRRPTPHRRRGARRSRR